MSRVYLFSYGSNGLDQLTERLGRRVKALPAYVTGWRRVFRGQSTRWGCGTASLKKKSGATTYGNVAELTAEDLEMLDVYEGVRAGKYRRIRLPATVRHATAEIVETVVAYVSTSDQRNPPNAAYLKAIAKNVGAFWKGAAGGVKPQDFYNED